MTATRLIIVAVGGQGNLLASKVLGEAALLSDVPVRMSEIHGMAQRGGVVESAIVFGDTKSSIIADGEADIFQTQRTQGLKAEYVTYQRGQNINDRTFLEQIQRISDESVESVFVARNVFDAICTTFVELKVSQQLRPYCRPCTS